MDEPLEDVRDSRLAACEESFREKATRDVILPKAGYDPLPEPGRLIYQPGSKEEDSKEQKEEGEVEKAPQVEEPE